MAVIATLTNVDARIDLGRVVPDNTLNSPHKFRCGDGNIYVVKPTLPDRQFANELLGLAIGNLLSIPLFDAAFVNLPAVLVQNSPLLIAGKYTAGVHFGSKMPREQSFNFKAVAPGTIRNNIANVDDFYRLVIFDELTFHGDRANNPGNLVAVESFPAPPRLRFVAIDHGYLFGGASWTEVSLRASRIVPIIPVMNVVQEVLTSRARLTSIASEASALIARFTETVNNARSSLSDGDRQAIVRFLTDRAPELAGWVSGPSYSGKLPLLV